MMDSVKQLVHRRLLGQRRKNGLPSCEEYHLIRDLRSLDDLLQKKVHVTRRRMSKCPFDTCTACQCTSRCARLDDLDMNMIDHKIEVMITNLISRGRLCYNECLILQHVVKKYKGDNLLDVLISQADGSRERYLENFITGVGGLSARTKQGFTAFSSNDETLLQLQLLPENPDSCIQEVQKGRIGTSSDAQDAGARIGQLVNSNFGMSSPVELCHHVTKLSAFDGVVTNSVNVPHLVKSIGLYEDALIVVKHYRALLILASSMQNLPYFFIQRVTWIPALNMKGVLVSKCTDNAFQSLTRDEVVNFSEFKQSLVDLAFLLAAVDLGKPVYGSCQGAHVGWLLAGGELVKWNKRRLTLSANHSSLSSIRSLGCLSHRSRFVCKDDGTREEVLESTMDENKFTSFEYVRHKIKGSLALLRTDFNHATVMRHAPGCCTLAAKVDDITPHPLATHAKHLKDERWPSEPILTNDSGPIEREDVTEWDICDEATYAVEYFT